MELQHRPEPWMCMPLAFAMALDMPVADLLAAIGHDGSEIVFPSLPEPLCRRCFHIQELIQVCLGSRLRRHAQSNCSPCLQPTEAGPHKTVLYPDNNWRRFEADDSDQSRRDRRHRRTFRPHGRLRPRPHLRPERAGLRLLPPRLRSPPVLHPLRLADRPHWRTHL